MYWSHYCPLCSIDSCLLYCKRGNFRVGVIFAFFALLSFWRKLPLHENKTHIPLWRNRSSIVKITPTWNVMPTFSRNFHSTCMWCPCGPWFGISSLYTSRSWMKQDFQILWMPQMLSMPYVRPSWYLPSTHVNLYVSSALL